MSLLSLHVAPYSMAARFDAIIVPFAALGAEDSGGGFGGVGDSASAAAGPLLQAGG